MSSLNIVFTDFSPQFKFPKIFTVKTRCTEEHSLCRRFVRNRAPRGAEPPPRLHVTAGRSLRPVFSLPARLRQALEHPCDNLVPAPLAAGLGTRRCPAWSPPHRRRTPAHAAGRLQPPPLCAYHRRACQTTQSRPECLLKAVASLCSFFSSLARAFAETTEEPPNTIAATPSKQLELTTAPFPI